MKRLLSATLAATLLGGSAAVAAPYDHDGRGYEGGYYRDRGDNNGAAIVAGLSFITLAAILASQHHHYHDGWYGRDDGRYYGNDGNGRDYGRGYGDGYSYRDHDGEYGR